MLEMYIVYKGQNADIAKYLLQNIEANESLKQYTMEPDRGRQAGPAGAINAYSLFQKVIILIVNNCDVETARSNRGEILRLIIGNHINLDTLIEQELLSNGGREVYRVLTQDYQEQAMV